MSKDKVRVFIVDDSSVFVKFLTEGLASEDPRIEIVGYAMNADDAIRKIPTAKPDVVTMDIEMPKTSGIEFLKDLLPTYLVPVILVSSVSVSVFDALANGAVDFVKKPDMSRNYSAKFFITNLANKVIGASTAKVQLPRSFGAPAASGGASGGSGGAGAFAGSGGNSPSKGTSAQTAGGFGGSGSSGSRTSASGERTSFNSRSSRAVQSDDGQTSGGQESRGSSISSSPSIILPGGMSIKGSKSKMDHMVIAIGASTGGTEATLQVLQQLPADTPGIVITQHMPEGFTGMYAQRLNKLCKMEVKEAVDGDVISRGKILIAPGGSRHMKVVKLGGHYTVNLFSAEKVNGHCPSVDVLFRSVAQTVKSDAVGIILTGMGQDGAYGLLEMRKAGAYTIGQNKESCVVYGMPMVAQNIGAVAIQSSCENIPNVLVNYLNKL